MDLSPFLISVWKDVDSRLNIQRELRAELRGVDEMMNEGIESAATEMIIEAIELTTESAAMIITEATEVIIIEAIEPAIVRAAEMTKEATEPTLDSTTNDD